MGPILNTRKLLINAPMKSKPTVKKTGTSGKGNGDHKFPDSPKNELTFVKVQESFEDWEGAVLKVCRACLATDARLYHMSTHNLSGLFQQITGVQPNPEDGLPKMLCWECVGRLTAARRFRERALSAQKLLIKLDAEKSITIKEIQSISETEKLFKSTLVKIHYDCNDCNLHINGDDEDIKLEVKTEGDGEDDDDDFGLGGDVSDEALEAPEMVMEMNDEHAEIFVDEHPKFESEKVCEKPKVKRKRKVKKEKEKEEEENPETTIDRYKTSDVKRRKTYVGVNEALFTVTKPTYEEQIAEVEQRRETSAYKSAPYKCDICYRGYLYRERYNVHIGRHSEKNGAYECFICKARFKTGRALRHHLTSHHTERFSCKSCTFVTRNRCVAKKHEKWHAGTKYQCPHCPTEFEKESTYLGHIRIKHVSKFVCELCGYTFVSEKGVDVHKKIKHRLVEKEIRLEGPFCQECNVRFLSQEAYDRHLKLSAQHTTDNDPNKIRNESQTRNAELQGRTRVRRTNIHPRPSGEVKPKQSPQGPVACEQCGIQLKNLRLYALHFQRTHPDKNRTKYPAMNPYMCEQCGRVFQSSGLLKAHMWMHGGEKRFKCERCHKGFTNKKSLTFHQRVHDAALPTYDCPVCGKSFSFPNNLRRHMFIHTGLKPFQCDTCGKSFRSTAEQRAHVDHVHLKKPWPKRARARAAQPMSWSSLDD